MKFELALLALVASASASNNFKRADSTTTSDDSSSSEVEDCNSEPCQIYRAIENDCKKDAGDDFAQLYTCLCESGDYWAGLAECNCGGGVPDIDEYKANYYLPSFNVTANHTSSHSSTTKVSTSSTGSASDSETTSSESSDTTNGAVALAAGSLGYLAALFLL
ncbi:hypothetical protein PICST_66507 [Scheffersomyces stipitis CBS 6054]|uniref:Uncharacterized protein n=1 Tax=Scheffersomyces stipitis (strain ATCC 58785 / CBS 6054 / NBRC 10063 / NRRL Y-11545) TaxID=322104 RepID=A3GGP8_PICST|nr:predicted protein [Scheffersomyces stipitis CBS 6054]EAZ63962.1 hypothetical protein PICST_66507 [Scheffersomyces stipitis CBS 6054]